MFAAAEWGKWNSEAQSLQPMSRQATEAVSDDQEDEMDTGTSATISGASGKHLKEELKRWHQQRSSATSERLAKFKLHLARLAWEKVELGVETLYDFGPFSAFINFIYDILQLSSGRDKFCALMQGYAKFMSGFFDAKSETHLMYRGVEDSFSEGRKIFRLFKEFREVYKVRRGFHRMQQGITNEKFPSVPAVCGCLDVCGHLASFFYYLFDNILWAASVGILRTKEIPKWQIGMWKGWRRNGKAINILGGVTMVKVRKDFASIWRLNFAITANVLLLLDAIRQCRRKKGGEFQGPDDPRLFHTLELAGMAASYRILMSKLPLPLIPLSWRKLKSPQTSGLLAMVAAVCGIWSNWRKVRRKKCGTKPFLSVMELREKLRDVAAKAIERQVSNDAEGRERSLTNAEDYEKHLDKEQYKDYAKLWLRSY